MVDEVHLDVAHVWQLDPDSPIPEDRRRIMCAPACVNMVLDFTLVKHGKYSFRIDEVAAAMQNHGGRIVEFGWKHSAQVATLKDHGLTAWRRNWLAPSQDPQYFIDQEGYNSQQIDAFLTQLKAEETAAKSPEDKAIYSIKASLQQGVPVILSVKAGFSDNEIGHMVVMSGYDEVSVDIVDPILRMEDQMAVTWEYFWKYFKLQAIFVLPPQA